MVRVHFVSDLHLEFWKPDHRRLIEKIPRDVGDVLILAGDIAQLAVWKNQEIEEIFALFAEKAKVVAFLPGNHEFYGQSIDDTLRQIDKHVARRVHVLSRDRGPVILEGGLRIVGATLWFPFDADNFRYERSISDFSAIRSRRDGKNFKDWVYAEHGLDKAALLQAVKPGDVLVTHHLPGDGSVHVKHKNSQLNRFFVAKAEELALERKPALWIHGHTHQVCDYMLGETRVVCNAAGYPYKSWGDGKAEETGWDPGRTVEVATEKR